MCCPCCCCWCLACLADCPCPSRRENGSRCCSCSCLVGWVLLYIHLTSPHFTHTLINDSVVQPRNCGGPHVTAPPAAHSFAPSRTLYCPRSIVLCTVHTHCLFALYSTLNTLCTLSSVLYTVSPPSLPIAVHSPLSTSYNSGSVTGGGPSFANFQLVTPSCMSSMQNYS